MEKLHVDESINDVVGLHPYHLLDTFKHRVRTMPDETAYVWMDDGERPGDTATYRELWVRATAIAAELQKRKLEGKSVVLLYSFEGLGFITAFWACIISGTVAVPTYPPDPSRLHRSMGRFELILNDSDCVLVLTTSEILKQMKDVLEIFPSLKRFELLATDTIDLNMSKNYFEPEIKRSDVAFLQYTSGSTGNPKGVMVTQGSLLFNEFAILDSFRLPERATACGWLPLYHDMGLIGFVVYAIFGGCHMHLMSPISFIKKPFRWLKLVSDTRSVATGGPNFAYELCVRKITDEQIQQLDLTCLKLLFSGAEPVRPSTIENFLYKFARCGFARNAFMPVYGLAEATLLTAGHKLHTVPKATYFRSGDLEKFHAVPSLCHGDDARALTSCGSNTSGPAYPLKIVDPVTLKEVPDCHVGEIWISGPTVAAGYYKKPELSQEIFHAKIAGSDDDTEYLRSGDLGFFYEGMLYVAGRQKDLIIINGRNHYPQDIELTVERNEWTRPGSCAAFSVEKDHKEVLVCVVEANMNFRKDRAKEMLADICQRIISEHEIQPYAIAILKHNTVCKTSSGKIQRRACKNLFLNKKLEKVAYWCLDDANKQEEEEEETAEAATQEGAAAPAANASKAKEGEKKINRPMSEKAQQIAAKITEIIGSKADKNVEIKLDVPFSSYGMSSPDVIGLAGELEEFLHVKLSPTILYEYSTIELLSRYLAGEDMTPEVMFSAEENAEPLAIVGMSCRFPGASSKDAFWQLIREGRDAITDIPASRFDVDAYYDPTPRTPGKMYVRKGGFINDVDLFDPSFFNISKSEATTMDPQQRILLTCVQEAFDDAGEVEENIHGSRTGVVVAVCNSDYAHMQMMSGDTSSISNAFISTGSASSVASNRISYQYDLQGPSVTVDTACSSSLVALDIAARYIRQGMCDQAVIGGANLILTPQPLIALSQAGFLSPDGHCKAFDAAADGFVRSEGIAAVVVKPLSAAHKNGDRIYAVVRSTAVNQDGRSNGLTAPNPRAQQMLIREACAKAKINPTSVQYVECHGTGTALGDPIEVSALNSALCGGRDAENSALLIGSVKSNIGHLEACAGMAGLMKLALSIYHKEIPPSILYHNPNPKIGFDSMPAVHVVDKLTPWPIKPAEEGKKKVEMLIGGVSSFGFGGTNAHAILSSDPSPVKHNDAPEDVDRFWPLTISAHSENSLRATVNQYAEWLSKPDSAEIYKVCPTVASRHMHKRYRAAFLGITKDELAAQMRLWLSGAEMDIKTQKKQAIGRTLSTNARKVCFIFCGQGPQWYGMARELLLTTPKFRDYAEELTSHFDKLPLDWDVRDEMSKMEDDESLLDQTKVAQVILFMFHVGLAHHLENVGVKCDAVIGHSLGEIGAACYAGMLEDAIASRLVFERATLMQETTGKGKMCAVSLTAEEAQPIIDTFDGKIVISCYNGPHHIVVSGDEETLNRCIEAIKAKFPERHTQMLPVNYVFHSPQLDFAVPKLTEILKTFYSSKPGRPDITMYSTVTGKPIKNDALTPEYWGSQIRRPVHFNEAVLAALKDGCHAMVEIAPNPVLSNYVRSIAESAGLSDVLVQPTLMRKVRDRTSVANTMMALWAHGCEVNPLKHMFNDDGDDWQGVDTFTDLPQRIWENQSLWIKPSRNAHKAISSASHPAVYEPSSRLEDCVYERTWAKQAADKTEKVCTAAILILDDSTCNKTFSIAGKLAPKFFANAYIVHYGESFAAINERECTANVATLNEAFAHFKTHFAAVVNCWPNCHECSAEHCDRDWEKSVTATIAVVNAVSKKIAREGGRCPIIVATHNAVSTPVNTDAVDPIQTACHGCVLTARQEYPELTVVAMDVSANDEDVAAMAAEIRAQVNAPSNEEPIIALHHGAKFAARVTRMSAPSSNTWIDGVRVRQDASYAITGGLGGLGLETANWLASKGAQHILLLDKFPASERAQKRMAEIAKEYPQARLEPIIMDIEDIEAVHKVIEANRDVRGIFHYAGVLPREVFPQVTSESVAKGLSAKILGALNMHTVSVELLPELEIFVMSSSISSLLPHMGQGVYSAGNCFLNGLAERRRAMKLPAFAMQIGLLGNVGMLATIDKNLASRVSAEEGLYPTPASDIIETMAYAMTSRGGNACCSTLFTRVDWDKYAPAIPMYASLRRDSMDDDEEDEDDEEFHGERQQKQHVDMHSEEEISDWLLKSFSDSLHVEVRELDPNAPLSNYGLQSVTVMDITSQLSSWLGIKVSPNIVYDYPTVNTLSKHLAEVVAKAASDDVPARKSKKKKSSVQSPLTSELVCSGRNEPIAVIGMACKFPGHCNNLAEYWDLLVNGRDAVTEVPIDRFDWHQFYDPDIHKPGKMNSKWGGFVDDIDKFDADFWSISPREADRLDPQQRMCLEMAWEALEDAGLVQARLAGKRNGLFVGLSVSDYGQLELLDRNVADAYFATGSFICMNANRLSYLLDFQGPSVAMDTACSSSTVAIHLACNALRNGEADVCLAGGVNAILSPTGALTLTKTGALSGDGHCFTFDARANGFVRSEGCGMVVLKPLSRALADGDRIHCLIDGSAVNQDGRSQGLTAPNGLAQQRLYEDAYARAGKSMTDIAYIECHGTGTTLGDHIEVESLGQTLLDHHRAADDRVIIGSVKPNLGHLECASGMPSLMKVALAMEHDFIPPSILMETPNPHIHFDTLPVRVSNGCEWPKNKPKLAGVSSFGFGGTNAHLVIEEAPAIQEQPVADVKLPVPMPYVVSVTSRSLSGLKETASVMAKFIASQTKTSLRDICYSLLCRRDQHSYRACFVSRNEDEAAARADIVAQLEAYASTPEETLAATVPRPLSTPKVGFIFSGQGPQHFGMARQLLAECPEFARAIDEVDAVFKKQPEPFSVVEELARPESECRLNETVCAQRVIFAIQYALAKCYAAIGVKPSCVIGHSLGELAAACIVGLLTLTDAAILIYHRSLIMNRATGLGKMLAVGLSQQQCESFVAPHADKVAFAAINSGNSCVLSGEQKALESVAEALRSALPNAFVKFLPVDYAFHSPQMEALAKELGQKVSELNIAPAASANASMIMYSTLTGARINSGSELSADYWASQVRKPVLFAKAVETAMEEHRADVFVELSPHPVLAYYVREMATARGMGAKNCAQLASMRRDSTDELACFWKSVAALHQWHVNIDWDAMFVGARYTRLPTYCWQKKRHWLANTNQCAQLAVGAPVAAAAVPAVAQDNSIVTPILETPTANVTGAEALSWSAHVVKPGPLEWEFDHCGFGSVLIPGVTYLEAALEASLRMHGPGMHILSDVRFHKPLFLGDATECTLHTSVLNTTAYDSTVLIKSCVDETAEKPLWQHHASIVVHKNRDQYADVGGYETDVKAILSRCPTVIDGSKYYEGLWPRGLQLGPAFRSMKTIHIGKNETLTEMSVPSHLHVSDYVFMPPVLDASMQCIGGALLNESEGIRGIYLPYHMDQLICWDRPTPKFYVHVIMHEPATKRALLGDVHAFTEDGKTLLYITNFECHYVEESAKAGMFYEQQWKQIESRAPRRTAGNVPCIIFANSKNDASEQLAKQLRDAGQSVYIVEKGTEAKEGRYMTPADTKESIDSVFEKILEAHKKVLRTGTPANVPEVKKLRVVYAWTLDCSEEKDIETVSLLPFQRLVNSLQGLASVSTQLWVVTAGGRCIATGENVRPCQSSIWGMAGIASQEYAQIKVVTCDLPASDAVDAKCVEHLAGQIIANGSGEDQLCLRAEKTYACRLAQASDPAQTRIVHTTLAEQPCRLEITKAGNLDNLTLMAIERGPLADDEVEVEVHASALNFRDVMRAMGLYPAEEDTPAVGLEAAGVVTRIGSAVKDFKVGDKVIGIASGGFGTHIVCPTSCCVKKPENWTDAEAAATTGVLMTAYVSLVWIAHVAKGEKVLVHSATGGVGLAALQICRVFGCEVFATCGRADKRRYLVEHEGIPEDHIFNSRSVAFADEIRRMTNGRGVDVVLNSLMGEGLLRSFELLAPQGRFVEIGKRDIFENTPIGLRTFSRNTLLASVAVDEYFKRNKPFANKLLVEVVGKMADGTYKPIPQTPYKLNEAVRGFRHMASTTHIGKIIVTVDPSQEVDVTVRAPTMLNSDATYVVVGFGGMGKEIVEWLLKHGAKSIVSLTVFLSPEWNAIAKELAETAKTQYNATFRVIDCDITDQALVDSVFKNELSRDKCPPVRGIIHAAGLVDDQLLSAMTEKSLRRVMAPKVLGTRALHEASLKLPEPLDFFICFSSIAALMGTMGQSNYAAANAYIDGLVAMRRAQGLPAFAFNWGPVMLGMTARLDSNVRAAMEAQGLTLLTRHNFIEQLEKVILTANRAELPPQLAVIRMDWNKWAAQNAGLKTTRRFSSLVQSSGAQTVAGRQFLQTLFALASPEKRLAMVTEKIVKNIAAVLSLPTDGFPVERPLNEMGLDSMVANEVRVKIEQEIGIPMSIASLIGGPPVSKLAKSVLTQIETIGQEGALGSGEDDADVDVSADAGPLSIAVDLTPEGADTSLPPIFAVCPAGGQAPIFSLLANKLNRRFIALQKATGDCESLNDLVSAHVRSIRRHCANGPYVLIGHSLGAVIAYEVAAQLEAGGSSVASLVMLDPINNETAQLNENPLEMAMLLCALGRSLCPPDALAEALTGRTGDALWEHFFTVCKISASERNSYRLAVNDIAAEISLFLHHEFTRPEKAVNYKLGIAIAGNNHPRAVELLRTDTSVESWKKLTMSTQVNSCTVKGDHWSILADPNVSELSAKIAPML